MKLNPALLFPFSNVLAIRVCVFAAIVACSLPPELPLAVLPGYWAGYKVAYFMTCCALPLEVSYDHWGCYCM